MKSLADQIAAAKREVEMRRKVYLSRVLARKMTQSKATHEIECMQAIIETLETFGQQEMRLE